MSTSRQKCDCTVMCGDDPWIKDGRATPCAAYVRYMVQHEYDAMIAASTGRMLQRAGIGPHLDKLKLGEALAALERRARGDE
ncbi:hypothetical protein P0D88_34845 [Paraburkholderia sp. RL18-103-BIB-C]|uniref:hypothetical protein n=1 Tax=Paraburkholderia sp. RL18-103-BIB-C TaxID=3031637 RepID=UPI0038B9D477